MLNLRKSGLSVLFLAVMVLASGCEQDKAAQSGSEESSESAVTYTNEIVFALPENDETLLAQTAEILENRVHLLGLGGHNIAQDSENGTVTVSIDVIEEAAPEVIERLSASNRLTLRRGADTAQDSESGETVPSGEILLSRSDVASAQAAQVQTNEGNLDYIVTIYFTEEGSEKFADVTTELAGTDVPLSIWMDNTLLLAPTVNEAVSTGEAVISGFETIDEAFEVADKINMGELPVGTEITAD